MKELVIRNTNVCIYTYLFIYNFKTYSLKDIKENNTKNDNSPPSLSHASFISKTTKPKILNLKKKKKECRTLFHIYRKT